MKNLSAILNGVLASILAVIAIFTVLPGSSARATGTPEPARTPAAACDTGRSISVGGTAVVNIYPDRALIQLGVQSNGATPQAVEAANSNTIIAVLQAVKSLGIQAQDIATDRYVIQPVYSDYNSLYIKGYRISNIVAVTLRDLEKVNTVIIHALEAGANQVVNVEFYTSQLRTYRDQARDLAIQAAAEKARDLAAAAGTDTGCVLTISENTWSYFNGGWYGDQQNLWTQNVVQNAAPGSGTSALSEAGPLSLGKISVRAEVSVTFGLIGP